jgi:type III restriction enzyme
VSKCGAQFRKADLQVHSPRDAGWQGARPDAELGPNPDPAHVLTAREAFCRSFITKCIEKGLGAVALTDHHEGEYAYTAIETLRKMRTEGAVSDNLWLFPGMELTCKDSAQALLLFDADLPKTLFEKARSRLGLPADTKPMEPIGIKIDLLDHNIADIQSVLAGDAELVDHFIVLPHVKPGGHKTVIRQGFHKRFREMPYVGGFMDCKYPHELDETDRKKIEGELPDWGSEKRGVICTSDARHADFRDLGKFPSWIKLATPTAESLRQAMLAPDSRIRHSEPRLPKAVITSLSVKGSRYLRDGDYLLNQQMNSVIGGRGAGKSSLLEYIRFALGCSALDDTASTRGSARMKEMLTSTLDKSTGEVRVEVLLNGAPVSVSRTAAKPTAVTVTAEGTSSQSSPDDVRRLIPTQRYRQGELSELASEEAAHRLRDLVTGRAAERIDAIEADLRKNGQQLTEALAKAVRYSAAQQQRAHAETQVRLCKAQLENLQKQLGEAGQGSSAAIAEHDKFVEETRSLESLAAATTAAQKSLLAEIEGFKETLKRIATNHPLVTSVRDVNDLFTAVKAAVSPGGEKDEPASLTPVTQAIEKWFDSFNAKIEGAREAWLPVATAHEAEYEKERKALAGKQSLIDSIDEMNQRLRAASTQLEQASAEEADLKSADAELSRLRADRARLQGTLVAVVREQAGRVKADSAGLARGFVPDKPDFAEVESALRGVLDVPHIRDKRIDDVIAAVTESAQPSQKWSDLLDELIALAKWHGGPSVDKGEPPSTPVLQAALEEGFMEKLRDAISVDRLATALRVVLRPRVEIFQVRGVEEIEFRKASQGEQAATLLNILMNQAEGPLIIDQPEEDLDNRIINDIIKTIRKTKDDRQLVLATHNANITVNGDSENVVELVLGEQRCNGAIDEPVIRDAITSTMEGGKDAFELRRKKYNF